MKGHEFFEELIGSFPSLADGLRDGTGLLHVQMECFTTFTTEAIEQDDLETVAQCFQLVSKALTLGDDDLVNAVYVSYLENMYSYCHQEKALRAHQLMPDRLLHAWKEMNPRWKFSPLRGQDARRKRRRRRKKK